MPFNDKCINDLLYAKDRSRAAYLAATQIIQTIVNKKYIDDFSLRRFLNAVVESSSEVSDIIGYCLAENP